MRRALLALLALAITVASCSSPGKDPLQATGNPRAAPPAVTPVTRQPAGTRLSGVRGPVTGTVVSGRTLAVVQRASLALYDLDALRAPPRTVPLPAEPRNVTATGGGFLVPLPDAHQVRTVAADGTVRTVRTGGRPTAAVRHRGALLVALPGRHAVAVLRDGRARRTITGDISPRQLYVAGGHVVALDTERTAAYDVDIAGGSFGAGIRAGQGAARGVVDRYGRLLVTDARTGGLLAFSAGPMLMRQRYPVGSTPFGIAYDRTRDLIWVTLTGSNEVAGFAVGRGQPEPRCRFPTVGRPDSVAVDPRSGTVFVGSAASDGVAVVRP